MSAMSRSGATDATAPAATVLNLQRMSTEDGPGLRTTVFLKGCSLACSWCHNPEAVAVKPPLVWYQAKCIGSFECVDACSEHALARVEDSIRIDHARCTACGDCVDRCPSGALETLGARWSLDELIEEVTKDRSYFEAYGGGVTVSGGEPALHVPFVAPFLERCRALGMHTAVDTCGMCSDSALATLVPHADLVLYDLKEIDSDNHREFTGQPNERILSNLLELAERMRATGRPAALWIRTPLIPGATLTDRNIHGIGEFIAEHLSDVVSRWELCSFNNLAEDKYERLGLTWKFAETPLSSASQLERAERVAKDSGVDPDIVSISGPARVECTSPASEPKEEAHDDTR
jgi:pyruvate formate lyase activating enzyme